MRGEGAWLFPPSRRRVSWKRAKFEPGGQLDSFAERARASLHRVNALLCAFTEVDCVLTFSSCGTSCRFPSNFGSEVLLLLKFNLRNCDINISFRFRSEFRCCRLNSV